MFKKDNCLRCGKGLFWAELNLFTRWLRQLVARQVAWLHLRPWLLCELSSNAASGLTQHWRLSYKCRTWKVSPHYVRAYVASVCFARKNSFGTYRTRTVWPGICFSKSDCCRMRTTWLPNTSTLHKTEQNWWWKWKYVFVKKSVSKYISK